MLHVTFNGMLHVTYLMSFCM